MAQRITELVDEAVVLDTRIAQDQELLKALKKRLVGEAQRRQPEQIPDGGERVTFQGTNGCIARVVFPKPKLKDTIQGAGKTYDKIVEITDDTFAYLFDEKPTVYKPTNDFREKVDAVFKGSSARARKLVDLCTSKSSPTVSFETKKNPEDKS